MSDHGPDQPSQAPRGVTEPHAGLLTVPPDGQLLYKIMNMENLLRSIDGKYLHFNRVDCFGDSPGADAHDGRQLLQDQQRNAQIRFISAPSFSAADYYDCSRKRTYACCFSLKNSDYLWKQYGKGAHGGKVCVVFRFGILRSTLNRTLRSGCAISDEHGNRCPPVFDLDYGIVRYVDWDRSSAHDSYLANPILHTYLKDGAKFSQEEEFRIALSALGTGQYVLPDNRAFHFPPSLHLSFDFRNATSCGTIEEVQCELDSQTDCLANELPNLRLVTRERATRPPRL